MFWFLEIGGGVKMLHWSPSKKRIYIIIKTIIIITIIISKRRDI